MHFILRQVTSRGNRNPIEIHITTDEVTVGRKSLVTLTRFPQISREHARFYRTDQGTLFVQDLKSLNGVYVNDVKIGSSLKSLSLGDVVGFGVTSNQGHEGFVCTVSCDNPPYQVKHEVIVISDDDIAGEPVPIEGSVSSYIPKSIKKSPSTSISPNINKIATGADATKSLILETAISFQDASADLHGNSTSPPKHVQNSDPGSNNLQSISAGLHGNSTSPPKHVQNSDPGSKNLQSISAGLHGNSVSTERSVPKTVEGKGNISVPHNLNNIATEKNASKNSKTVADNNFHNFSVEFHSNSIGTPKHVHNSFEGNGSTLISHNANWITKTSKLTAVNNLHATFAAYNSDSISHKRYDKTLPKNMYKKTKKCIVLLERCDSSQFVFPPDIQNPFLKKHQNNRAKRNSSESSRPCLHGSNSYINLDLGIMDKDYTGSYLLDKKITLPDTQKRQFSSSDNTLDNSFPKRLCLASEKPIEKVPEQKSLQPRSIDYESDHDNEMIYSQAEEIIDISDDESYLDFQSSQNYPIVKKEPEEIEEQHLDDIAMQIFETHNDAETSVYDTFCPNPEANDNVESIEDIRAFVGGVEQKDTAKETEDSNVNHSLAKSYHIPDLSDSTDSDEDSDSNENLRDIEMPLVKEKSDDLFTFKQNKKVGIKLIEPQPMQQHSYRRRRKDEGFSERSKSRNLFSGPKRGNSNKVQAEKSPPNSNLKNYKIPFKHKNDNHKVRSEKDNRDFPKKSNKLSKKSPVKRRPEKFSSRMGFLTTPAVNPQSVKRNETKANVKVMDSQNKNKRLPERPGGKPATLNPPVVKSVPAVAPRPFLVPPTVPPVNTSHIFNRGPPVHNPRDPRQNRDRIAHSLGPNSVQMSAALPTEGKNLKQITATSSDKVSNKWQHPVNQLLSDELRLKLIKTLIVCNTKWLEEQSNMKRPPPPIIEGAADLPLKHKSYESYVSSFYPMIKLEVWEQMYDESKELFASQKQCRKFYFSVLASTIKDDFIELKCESVVNEKVCFGPREGYLTILELKRNLTQVFPVIGYVLCHKILPFDLYSPKVHRWDKWKRVPEEWLRNAKHWVFYVYVKKKKDLTLTLDCLMKGNGLCYIRNKLRWVDALSYVKHSRLLPDILQPRWNTFLVNYPSSLPTREYNSCQMEVITGIATKIKKSSEEPTIMLVQGPPGTGKTHTIIGLLHKLLTEHKSNCHFKILVTAPSNAAIDEIGCRLIAFNDRFGSTDSTIKFVRVGSEEQIHPKMKPHFLDRIVKDMFYQSGHKERELQDLCKQIAILEKEGRDIERLKYLKEKYKLYNFSNSTREMNYHTEMKYKVSVLKDCNIVLSTLSSCSLSFLLKNFYAYFTCCIVDESTQCTEIEILQPLMLGIDKLILVGDHCQLPATVLSKTACQHGFERSAFERFHVYFNSYRKQSPMYTLTEQFRMHSAICEFPSKYIYDGKVVTNPGTDLKYKDFPFLSYMLLDILVSQETNASSSKTNNVEANVIVNICSYLTGICSPSSIGIITPYQAQRSLYLEVLGKGTSYNPRYAPIEVNTVDGFQGREKDVIILSSVRANSQSGSIGFLAHKQRLNVAITRARKCLIICAHVDSLQNAPGWRELIMDARRRKICFAVTSEKDIPMLFTHDLRKRKND